MQLIIHALVISPKETVPPCPCATTHFGKSKFLVSFHFQLLYNSIVILIYQSRRSHPYQIKLTGWLVSLMVDIVIIILVIFWFKNSLVSPTFTFNSERLQYFLPRLIIVDFFCLKTKYTSSFWYFFNQWDRNRTYAKKPGFDSKSLF